MTIRTVLLFLNSPNLKFKLFSKFKKQKNSYMPFHMPAGKCTRSRAWGTQVISKTEFLAELYPIFNQIAIKFMVSAW